MPYEKFLANIACDYAKATRQERAAWLWTKIPGGGGVGHLRPSFARVSRIWCLTGRYTQPRPYFNPGFLLPLWEHCTQTTLAQRWRFGSDSADGTGGLARAIINNETGLCMTTRFMDDRKTKELAEQNPHSRARMTLGVKLEKCRPGDPTQLWRVEEVTYEGAIR